MLVFAVGVVAPRRILAAIYLAGAITVCNAEGVRPVCSSPSAVGALASVLIAERARSLHAVQAVGLAAGVSSAKERARIVRAGDGVKAVIGSALVDGAKRAAVLIALVVTLVDAASMIKTVSMVILELAAAAPGLGTLQLHMRLAKCLEAALGAGFARLLARRDATFGVLKASFVGDGLGWTGTKVAGVRDAEVAVRVRIGARIALECSALLVLLAALLEKVAGSVFASFLGAAICDPVRSDFRSWQEMTYDAGSTKGQSRRLGMFRVHCSFRQSRSCGSRSTSDSRSWPWGSGSHLRPERSLGKCLLRC
jgi:hypothetical protein